MKRSIDYPLLIERGCGLDVHKSTIVATVIGIGIPLQTRSFSCFTKDLIELRDWLLSLEITHVAMESTGVYWKPVFNILEAYFEVLLVNARYIKNVPGKKTDKKDSEWIAQLLVSGLLENSFVPPRLIRNLRDLSRYRKKIKGQQSSEKNRIHKQLQDANIKLSSVISDLFGASGLKILEAMVRGETCPQTLAAYASKRLRASRQELIEALDGCIEEHHRFMLTVHLENIRDYERLLEKIDQRMEDLLQDYQPECQLLESIPGISHPTAKALLAEIGPDMSVFPDQHHLSSWAGVCPGNHMSAGKNYHSRARPGNKALKTTLMEAAWAATATKDSWFRTKYYKMSPRMGAKKALFAIAHKLLIVAYKVLQTGKPYQPMQI
ncbi:IS110 family transposase [Rapidithrix thailandica]|uniref:IS110 family transposase n=1 Tax=Rapidithrix thailandica TaxID=413964 RepID=A0AAW9S934_9BACT